MMLSAGCTASESPTAVAPSTTMVVGPQIEPNPVQPPQWKPRHPLAPVVMTESEKLERRQQELDRQAASYGLQPWAYPDLVRWIVPEQTASVMVPCLKQKGFVAEPSSTDGRGYKSNTGSQDEAWGRADVECQAMYSVDPRLLGEPSPDQKNLVYDYWIEFLVPCLKKHGINPTVPSREVFVSTPTPMAEYPFGNDVIEKECPYGAPSQALLGEL